MIICENCGDKTLETSTFPDRVLCLYCGDRAYDYLLRRTRQQVGLLKARLWDAEKECGRLVTSRDQASDT